MLLDLWSLFEEAPEVEIAIVPVTFVSVAVLSNAAASVTVVDTFTSIAIDVLANDVATVNVLP